jgi:hypothetical protein
MEMGLIIISLLAKVVFHLLPPNQKASALEVWGLQFLYFLNLLERHCSIQTRQQDLFPLLYRSKVVETKLLSLLWHPEEIKLLRI